MFFVSYLLMTILMFLGLFLIGLVLLQRGRGGGLVGALGGAGGAGFAGTKAGDVFTRITIGIATAWILLAGICVIVLHNTKGGQLNAGNEESKISIPKDDPKRKIDRRNVEELNEEVPPLSTSTDLGPQVPVKDSLETPKVEPAPKVEPVANDEPADAVKTDEVKPKPEESTDVKPE